MQAVHTQLIEGYTRQIIERHHFNKKKQRERTWLLEEVKEFYFEELIEIRLAIHYIQETLQRSEDVMTQQEKEYFKHQQQIQHENEKIIEADNAALDVIKEKTESMSLTIPAFIALNEEHQKSLGLYETQYQDWKQHVWQPKLRILSHELISQLVNPLAMITAKLPENFRNKLEQRWEEDKHDLQQLLLHQPPTHEMLARIAPLAKLHQEVYNHARLNGNDVLDAASEALLAVNNRKKLLFQIQLGGKIQNQYEYATQLLKPLNIDFEQIAKTNAVDYRLKYLAMEQVANKIDDHFAKTLEPERAFAKQNQMLIPAEFRFKNFVLVKKLEDETKEMQKAANENPVLQAHLLPLLKPMFGSRRKPKDEELEEYNRPQRSRMMGA